MTKHLIDHPRETRDSRLARFTRIAREEAPRKVTRHAQQQNRDRATERLLAYTRIARGKLA
jgi:hypothetical protein